MDLILPIRDLSLEEEVLEAEDVSMADSNTYFDDSETMSVTSSIYKAHVENGRRYQTKREGEYWGPSDAKQFGSQQKAHILHFILDSQQHNPLFFSPVPPKARILDIGSGTGDWATDTADHFPSATVLGVDLAPVPVRWVPPNCTFEVDDILKPWAFQKNGFNLVHFRHMYGAFTDEQWRLVYEQAYKNLAPGAWIEQVEPSIIANSDDHTLPADSVLRTAALMFINICAKTGKGIDTEEHFKSRIEAAGFTNIHEKLYKVPIGGWVKNPLLKEAGCMFQAQLLEGAEGYFMFLLTHFGEPRPWTPEEVQAYLTKYRDAVNDPSIHAYQRMRRVWAQKPVEPELGGMEVDDIIIA